MEADCHHHLPVWLPFDRAYGVQQLRLVQAPALCCQTVGQQLSFWGGLDSCVVVLCLWLAVRYRLLVGCTKKYGM